MTLDVVEAAAPMQVGPLLSAVVLSAIALTTIALFVQARVRARRASALARAAEGSAHGKDAPLATGHAVIFGPVELARDERVAVRVEIEQIGREESSGSWTFSWTEQHRVVQMRPFYVVHPSGARVRVEPQDRAYLVDAMDGMIVARENLRTRYAELSPGEQVFAVGELSRAHDPELPAEGYRGAPMGWVMRPPPGEDLLLSSEPLEKRFQRRARGQRLISYVVALVALAQAFLFFPYVERLVNGRDERAKVLIRSHDTDSDGDSTYAVQVVFADGRGLDLEATSETFTRAKEGSLVPVRYVPAHPWTSALGRGASANGNVLFLSLGLLAVAFAARSSVRRRHEAWYERPLVDKGSGRLWENGTTTSM